MPKLRGPKAGTVKLDLSEGDWIEVKTALSAGEERDIAGASIQEVTKEGSYVPDTREMAYAAAATYIQRWSFKGQDGLDIFWPNPAPLKPVNQKTYNERIQILRDQLDDETMREIEKALEEHRKTLQFDRSEEKNGSSTSTGDKVSETTSLSVVS